MEQGPSGVLGGRSYRAGAPGFSSELQMTVDATPVVATVVAITVGTVACRALHPLGGPAAVPPTELRAAASLVCASHPWPLANAPTGGRAGHSAGCLAFSHAIIPRKSFYGVARGGHASMR
jgi:hypothetical protein